MSKGTETGSESDSTASGPPWVRAKMADLNGLDFEQPITASSSADCVDLREKFRSALKDGGADTPASRVYAMLEGVSSMYLRPDDRDEPFGAMFVFSDGRRTAKPSDFREHVDLLADMIGRCTNLGLQARMADICWLLDRKRRKLGLLAIASYVELVKQVDAGSLHYRFEDESGALDNSSADHLRRALHIARGVGWDEQESLAARTLVSELQERATKAGDGGAISRFSELSIDFGVSEPAAIADSIENFLLGEAAPVDVHHAVDLWRLAARANRAANRDEQKHRCQAAAAECLAAHAETLGSALVASHFLSDAIAQLHGIPEKKDRRNELKHRLVDIQARVPEEMSSFSQEIDLSKTVEKVKGAVESLNLLEKLFVFARLCSSPDPDDLIKEAREIIRRYPLSSLFGGAHVDREGKVIHRSVGGNIGDTSDASIVQDQISRLESIRRACDVASKIEVARQSIVTNHFISDDILVTLLRHSPFVPPDLVATFARGFARYFQGDFISATYVLTPLLENSLRHVLKAHGHDVTTFDDSTQTQKDRTLSSLFDQMRSELDAIFTKGITTDLDNLFLNKPGPHLRHTLCHGLLHDKDPFGADAIYGIWLMFRLCLLPIASHRHEIEFPFA